MERAVVMCLWSEMVDQVVVMCLWSERLVVDQVMVHSESVVVKRWVVHSKVHFSVGV